MGQVSYHIVHMFYASSDRFEILSVKEVFFRTSSRCIYLLLPCSHNACILLFRSLLWDHTRTRTDQKIQLDHVFPSYSPLSSKTVFDSLNQLFAHPRAKDCSLFCVQPLLISQTSVCFYISGKTHRRHEPFLRNEDNTMGPPPMASTQHIPAFLHYIRHHRPTFHTCGIC